jgi:hypothetical protein
MLHLLQKHYRNTIKGGSLKKQTGIPSENFVQRNLFLKIFYKITIPYKILRKNCLPIPRTSKEPRILRKHVSVVRWWLQKSNKREKKSPETIQASTVLVHTRESEGFSSELRLDEQFDPTSATAGKLIYLASLLKLLWRNYGYGETHKWQTSTFN